MTDEKPCAVFDCNVLLQAAAREKSVAAKCLRFAESGRIRLFVSKEILAEVEDVLNRPEIRAHFADLTDEVVSAFLKRLQRFSTTVRYVTKKFSYSRDEDDEPYINVAVAAGAHFIVSCDKDLLDLMTGHTEECKDFRRRFRPLKVIDPVGFLREVERATSSEETKE